ncbi:hypothetical protein ES703_21249 [subsurface metagenome]
MGLGWELAAQVLVAEGEEVVQVPVVEVVHSHPGTVRG